MYEPLHMLHKFNYTISENRALTFLSSQQFFNLKRNFLRYIGWILNEIEFQKDKEIKSLYLNVDTIYLLHTVINLLLLVLIKFYLFVQLKTLKNMLKTLKISVYWWYYKIKFSNASSFLSKTPSILLYI